MSGIEKRDQPASVSSSPSLGRGTGTVDSINFRTPATSTTSFTGDVEIDPQHAEGGLRAKLTVLGSFIALFCTVGHMSAFGTYQSWYSNHQLQHISPATISWIGSLQLWVFFFLGGIIGRAFDTSGPFRLMASGTVLHLLSAICTSFSTRYYEYILSQGALFGISIGLLFYPSVAGVSVHFLKYRATAVGIAAAGSSVGGVVYAVVLQLLFQKVGFSWAVRICGISSTLLCAAATLLVTSPPAERKPGPIFTISITRDVKFLFLAAGSCFVVLGIFIPFFYIIEYTKWLTGDAQASFLVLAMMNAGSVVGRVLPAYVSDAIGRFNLLAPFAFLAGLSCLILWRSAYDLPLVFVFASLYGFFSGAFISVINPCIAQISDEHELGTRIGMLYSLISFPALLGGPVAGVLLAKYQDSYKEIAIFSGLNLVVGSLLILCAKLAINRNMFAKV